MSKSKRRLGEILYKKGYVGKEKLIESIKKGKKEKKRLGEVLIAFPMTSSKSTRSSPSARTMVN
ncbi:MAG: hypothetical protein ACYSUS_06495 [Planctomycetota bacterium]|jgi:hypothetical protein